MKHFIDIAAFLSALGAILHWMPDVAGLMGVIWYTIRIYEHFNKKNK